MLILNIQTFHRSMLSLGLLYRLRIRFQTLKIIASLSKLSIEKKSEMNKGQHFSNLIS